MNLFHTEQRIFVPSARGTEALLASEIISLGLPVDAGTGSGIETRGSMQDAMRLNLHLRTGLRVLMLVSEFRASRPDELYHTATGISWEEIIPLDGYFSINETVDTPSIDNSRFAVQKCKDAIADRFMKKFGRRPDSGPLSDRTVLHLYWQGEDCRIYVDTSGESLSKRGYRKIPYKAPLQETLAAAIVLSTGWKDDGHFVNPMCGSGTLAIEAALIGLNRPAAIHRNNFGFMHLNGYDPSAWEEIRKAGRAASNKAPDHRIIATDISSDAIEAAQSNARTAGVEHLIEFIKCDFGDTPVPEGGGVVVMNPEYGERLGKVAELGGVYARIGDFLKQNCRGYRGYVFTGNLDLVRKIGLRTKRKMLFYNGPIECRLLEYELYQGSRKPIDKWFS